MTDGQVTCPCAETGAICRTEYAISPLHVGDIVLWQGRRWRIRAVYPSYRGQGEEEHDWYYKIDDVGIGNRFLPRELEATGDRLPVQDLVDDLRKLDAQLRTDPTPIQ